MSSTLGVLGALALASFGTLAAADDTGEVPPRILEFRFTPVGSAQIALWLEDDAGKFLSTAALTEAVALRGIGNRPGASQMNSGFRWPYGRREGVLPIWARARLSGEGAKPFRRVIFQNRNFEGLASRTSEDYSKDDYFCLSFNNSRSKKDALDAVSCASTFSSDKGRFMTADDQRTGYAEPYEDVSKHVGRMQPLALESLYPPRHDVKSCLGMQGCLDHKDVAAYDAHVREVLPDIDAISMATPKGGESQQRIFSVPESWPSGRYRACLEINVEGDYNGTYNDTTLPTPTSPMNTWDSWAVSFGYPYRGQPSVVYCVPFELQSDGERSFHVDAPTGSVASWDTAAGEYGKLQGVATMTDDHEHAPGSGADRLLAIDGGSRFELVVRPQVSCEGDAAPGPISELTLSRYPDELEAHQWAGIGFRAASDDKAVFSYDVRVSTEPIVDDDSFMRGMPARTATMEAEQLSIPAGTKAGAQITTNLGGLVADTHYYVGVRAVDGCAHAGPFRVAEMQTPERVFATVTPCFIATAAYGTPLAAEISVLRRFRDRYLASNAVGRVFVDAYVTIGPKLAKIVRGSEALRAATRTLLTPLVGAARVLDTTVSAK